MLLCDAQTPNGLLATCDPFDAEASATDSR